MPQTTDRNSRLVLSSYLLVGLGLLLVVVGLSWQHLVPDTAFWSEAQAEAYTEANRAAHAATIVSDDHDHAGHSHAGHSHEPMTAQQRASTIEEFEQLKQQLEKARSRRQGWGRPIAILGALLAGAGIIGLRSVADGG